MSDFPPPPPPSGFPPPPPGPFGTPPPPGYTAVYGDAGPSMQYAGVGARLGALLIDGILMALLFIPAFVVIVAGPTELNSCTLDEEGFRTSGSGVPGICEDPTGGTIAAAALLGLVALAGTVLYQTFMVGGTGQTLGKKAVGVRVVDASSGAPIGNGRALGRYLFSAFISGNLCALGYLWALWDQRKQTWHDKVVSSVVVKA